MEVRGGLSYVFEYPLYGYRISAMHKSGSSPRGKASDVLKMLRRPVRMYCVGHHTCALDADAKDCGFVNMY